ncbi:MAG: ABC transporter ATP-binding protein [Candidatus Marinimicrobia bacterium]|nr:ABC transporter ATP-binding protein [Candidatus Neomarinimicrobiota bacterium]
MAGKLLDIKGLRTRFKVGDEWAEAVNGVDFHINEGETLGIVGESGSGKSVSVLSLIQLIPNPPGEVVEGEIYFKGEKIFDGNDLGKVRERPKYRFFNSISENVRKAIASLFFIGWFFLHNFLGMTGVVNFFISLILDGFITQMLFFNSPRKKAMQNFHQKMYARMRSLRGREIAMIFQEPMTSLNPVFTVGMQMIEAIYPKSFAEYHKDGVIRMSRNLRSTPVNARIKTSAIFGVIVLFVSQLVSGWTFSPLSMIISFICGAAAASIFAWIILLMDKLISPKYHAESDKLEADATKLLELVGIPSPDKRLKDYPHQFSGGMRQRAMIAMALAKNPSLLIADEPTTALDVTIQAQILELMMELKNKRKEAAIVLITHDLAVVAETCERVIVMYGGVIQEVASSIELFKNPLHPYTLGLLESIPRPDLGKRKKRLGTIRGMVPSILEMPEGCKFCTRCDLKVEMCDTVEPPLQEIRPNHFVRCHVKISEAEGVS